MTRRERRRRRWIIFGVLIIALGVMACTAVFIRQSLRDAAAREARVIAMEAYEDGDYEVALRNFSKYLGRYDQDVEALVAFAHTRSRVEEPQGRHVLNAIGLYNRALLLEPQNLAACEGLLDLYSGIRYYRRPEFLAVAERILAIDADHVDALEARAWCAARVGRYGESADDLKRICEISPENLDARKQYIAAMHASGADLEAVLRAIDTVVADHETAEFHMLRAMAYATRSDQQAATTSLNKALEFDPSLEVLDELLAMLNATNRTAEAMALLDRAKATTSHAPEVYEIATEWLWHSGRNDEAIAEIDSGYARNQADPGIGLLRWRALLHVLRNSPVAAEALAQFREDGSVETADHAMILALEARISAPDATTLETIRGLRSALQYAPDSATIAYMLGEAYAAAGEWERACQMFETAHEANIYWTAAADASVNALLRVGRIRDAYFKALSNTYRYGRIAGAPYITLLRAWNQVQIHYGSTPTGDLPPFAGLQSSDVLAEILYQNNDRAPAVLGDLVEAYAIHDRKSDAEAAITSALAEDAPALEVSHLLRLADLSLKYRLNSLETTLNRAADAGAPPFELVTRRSWAELHRGDAEAGWARLASFQPADEAQSHQLLLIQLQYQIARQAPSETIGGLIDQLIAAERLTASEAIFVLSRPEVWEDSLRADRAIGRLEQLMGADSVRARLARAQHLTHFGATEQQIAEASTAVSDVLIEQPQSLPALTLMARLLEMGEIPEYGEAARFLQQAVDLHPERESLYPELIRLYQRAGNFGKAEQYLARLAQLRSRDRRTVAAESQLFISQGDFAKAFERMHTLVGEDAPATDQLALASIALRAGRFNEVEQLLDSVARLDPASPLYLRFAIDYRLSRGQVQQARDVLASAAGKIDAATHAFLESGLAHRLGESERAMSLLKDAIEAEPSNAFLHGALAARYMLLGEHSEAVAAAKRGLELTPDDQELQIVLASASLALSSKERRAAIEWFSKRDRVQPGLLETLELFDAAANDDGKFSSDRAHLREARDLVDAFPDLVPAWRLAITLHESAGDRNTAVQLAQQAASRLRSLSDPAMWLTELHMRGGDATAALGAALTWRERSQHDPFKPDVILAQLHMYKGAFAQAATTLDAHATRLSLDTQSDAFALWLRALILSRRITDAEAVARSVLGEENIARLWMNASLELSDLDPARASVALRALEPAIGENVGLQIDFAMAWARIGKRLGDPALFQRAEAILTRIEQGVGRDIEIIRAWAMLATEEGRHEDAVACYREIIAQSPDDSIALNNLAYALANDLGRASEALALSARAVELRPDIMTFADTHALVLLEAGETERALRTIDRVIEKHAASPEYRLTRARIALAAGNTQQARSDLLEAERAISAMAIVNSDLRQTLDRVRRELATSTAALSG